MPQVLFNSGSAFINSGHLVPDDPSTFAALTYQGTGTELLFDRRTGVWANTDVYLFTASYADGLATTVRVNLEFGSVQAAQQQALFYAEAAGRMPTLLRQDMATISIHLGDNDYGGGSGDLLIHTGRTPTYQALGSLDEIIFHELVHVSLDADYAGNAGWLAAQLSDDAFVTAYARDNPNREDLAETFLLYYVYQQFPSRMTASETSTLTGGIPDRLTFLDGLSLDLGMLSTAYTAQSFATTNDDYLLLSPSDITLDALGGDDTVEGNSVGNDIQGGDGMDSLSGSQGADTLSGDAGEDTLVGGSGNDSLVGGTERDHLLGGNNADRLRGGLGRDTLEGGNGDDRLEGGKGRDRLEGGDGEDRLIGGNNNDNLFGQAGNDRLEGGTGNDRLTGGKNADTFVFEDGFGNDTITDFAATNNSEDIDLSAVTAITDYADLLANHIDDSSGTVIIDDGAGNTITLNGITSIGQLDAGDFLF